MLQPTEVCRRIKPVDLAPVLRVLDRLEFDDSGGVCAWVTRQGSVAPVELVELVRSLGLGGRHGRMFCRKLLPRQNIAPHVDEWVPAGWRRFQLPLVSHPAIRMRWPEDGVEEHLAPGWLYEVRFDRLHEVVNDADVERVHVQIDQIGATI